MPDPTVEQIRSFRLHAHHLDAEYDAAQAEELVGACGMQNSPPGAWEAALFNRAPACHLSDATRMLSQDKTLVQAWSLRGAPYVFPADESATFLSPLVPSDDEPWAYTNGIGLAIGALHLEFDADAAKKLVRKFIHCYGPTTANALAGWMGCSGKQARRLWHEVVC